MGTKPWMFLKADVVNSIFPEAREKLTLILYPTREANHLIPTGGEEKPKIVTFSPPAEKSIHTEMTTSQSASAGALSTSTPPVNVPPGQVPVGSVPLQVTTHPHSAVGQGASLCSTEPTMTLFLPFQYQFATTAQVPVCAQTREIGIQRKPSTTAVGCQAYCTIPRKTKATQLSKGSLLSVRSQGCQAIPTLCTRSIAVGTDNQGLKRSHRGQAPKPPPAKRPWVAISFKDIGLLTGLKNADSPTSEKSSTFIQTNACRDRSDCLPSLHVSKRNSSGVDPKDVSFSEHTDLSVLEDVFVNLGCLLQLFRHCGRCRGVCAVSSQGDRKRFSVLGRCKDCSQQTTWSNQPFGVSSGSRNNGKSPCRVQVSDELVNPPPDEGKGRTELPESPTTTSTASNRHEGTGVNERQGKADGGKTETLFVELDVTIDSDGEQSTDEDISGRLEEEVEEEEVKELGMEVEETDRVGVREEGEKENGGIEKVANRQWLGISWPEWDDWQPEEEEEKRQEEMEEEEEEEEEGEEEEQMDEDDEDWEAEEEEDVLDSDSESDSEDEKETQRGNVEGSGKPRRPQSSSRRHNRLSPLLCPDCGVTYTSLTHRCCNKGVFMVCSECGARCLSEVSLKLHKMDCRGRTYACKYCLKQLATCEDKIHHETLTHSVTEKNPYLCSECPQRFSSLRERQLHLKQHRKIICQTCHKQFASRSKLKRHMLSHSSEKPYKCKMCGRAFAQACQLKCHTRVHSGEQPYKCQLCPLSFNHNVSLKNHVRRHHQEEGQDDPDPDSLVTTATGEENN